MNKNDKNWGDSALQLVVIFERMGQKKATVVKRQLVPLPVFVFLIVCFLFVSMSVSSFDHVTLFKASTSLLCNMNECMNTMKILNNSTPSPSVRSYLYILLVYVHITPVTNKVKKGML